MSERAETLENVKINMKLTVLEEVVIIIIKGFHRCSFAVSVAEKFIVELGVHPFGN